LNVLPLTERILHREKKNLDLRHFLAVFFFLYLTASRVCIIINMRGGDGMKIKEGLENAAGCLSSIETNLKITNSIGLHDIKNK